MSKKNLVEALKAEDVPEVQLLDDGKKDISGEMPNAYNPRYVEQAWYEWWEKKGVFQPSEDPKNWRSGEKFVIVQPPPNVTGYLHMGHALTTAIQDCLVRWHRQRGDLTLWVPGMDHAGIATQTVVEKKLQLERNVSRHDLGREAFLKEVWKWKESYGGRITDQLRRVGASLDWTRSCFTMDDARAQSVQEAFIRMYKDGLIFRDTRLVNWCSKLKSAISDIEVDYVDIDKETYRRVPGHGEDRTYPFGALWSFAYKVVGSDEEIVIATTRPETLLGDTAVAVHPEDPRYKHLHGAKLQHPFIDRQIPVITDAVLVDMSFGTGAVKITPAHDPNDYECGKRNNLPFINVLNDDGTINENGGEFAGQKRFEVRRALIKRMEEMDLFRGKQNNAMRLGICSRTGDVIEPMVKPQWYVKCDEMAARSVEAVRSGELKLVPETHEKTWFHWLENIHDWCISRQLWWGHRIPAYEIKVGGGIVPPVEWTLEQQWVVAETEEEALAIAQERMQKLFNIAPENISIVQDEDVLDTWFSSGLFPFSVFNWPEQTADLEKFYPGTLLETGHDILFFWVARMVMMGLQLTGKLPFEYVYLHAMVRDKEGRKMSKTLGNVVDPLDVVNGISLADMHNKLTLGNLDPKEVERAQKGQTSQFPQGIAECGADAMRFALLAYTQQGRDINLDINRVHAYRTFCNKLWNAVKFALMNIGDDFKPSSAHLEGELLPMNSWILSRLAFAVEDVNTALEGYLFGQATTSLYSFWLYDLCDVYLESIKPVMAAGDAYTDAQRAQTRQTLFTALEVALRLMHPFMPFLTEELWQRLPHGDDFDSTATICQSCYPTATEVGHFRCADIEANFDLVKDIAHQIRSLRSDYNLSRSNTVHVTIRCRAEDVHALVSGPFGPIIGTLGYADPVEAAGGDAETPAGFAVGVVNDACDVLLDLRGQIKPEDEIKKLQKKKQHVEKGITGVEKRLQNPKFLEKSPEHVVQSAKENLESLKKELESITNAMASLSSMLE